jgi:type II secretory pathway pseudopilin PulG
MKFLTFLFFLFAGLWLAGLVGRALLGRWLRRKAEQFNAAAQQAQKEARSRGRREGEVTVETVSSAAEKKVNRSVGEYVEFEEVESAEKGDNAGAR